MQDQFRGYPSYCVRGSLLACFLDISRPNFCFSIFYSHHSCYISCPSVLHGVDDVIIWCEVYKLQSPCRFALHSDTFTFFDTNYKILKTLLLRVLRMEVWLYAYLTLPQDSGERSSWRSGRLTPRKETTVPV
jgi:hypothetical protein